jgi:purine-binding chemotaxis protein CheW
MTVSVLSPAQLLPAAFDLPAVARAAEPASAVRRRAFRIGRFDLVLRDESRMELVSAPDLYPLPFAPAACSGLINLRGALIPLFDWREALGEEAQERTYARVLILGAGREMAALAVSEILAQVAIAEVVPWRDAGAEIPQPFRGAITASVQVESRVYFQLDLRALLGGVAAR